MITNKGNSSFGTQKRQEKTTNSCLFSLKLSLLEFSMFGRIMIMNKGNSSFGTQKRQEKVIKTPVFFYLRLVTIFV